MRNKIITVFDILPESIAEEAGIEKGDVIVSINGETIGDIFDYRFLTYEENLQVNVLKNDGELWEIEIEKDEYEDLGIEFESSMIDEAKSCTNKCVFCFIDQLPRGMRETLYFKDDDSRLSFLTGNYVTLTNLTDSDLDRLVKYKMSPINISVHTTDKDLRVLMLRNKNAGNILERIKLLTDGGITVNCQIVLCRDVNDGKELDRTVMDLANLYPGVKSISVVPVGLTSFREGLYNLVPFDKMASLQVINQINICRSKFLGKYNSRIVYLADEFYIMAEEDIPDIESYEDFPQIENGVGLIALMRNEFFEHLEFIREKKINNVRNISIATGESAFNFIKNLAEEIEKRYCNISINVFEIKNNFFGGKVTVAGLLTGRDIAAQLTLKPLGDELLLSRSMLKAGEEIFLDDFTASELEKALGIKIQFVENSGKDFIEKIIGY